MPTKLPAAPKALAVPKLTDEEIAQLQSDDAEIREMSMVGLLNKSLPAMPPGFQFKVRERRLIELMFSSTAELIGGVPAMALWAQENPTEFYKLLSRLIPQEKTATGATQINIISPLGKNPLDMIDVPEEATRATDADYLDSID